MGKKRALIPREQLTTTLILYQTTLPSTVDLSTKMQERAVELMSHILYRYICNIVFEMFDPSEMFPAFRLKAVLTF
jgi:hypothetical protein